MSRIYNSEPPGAEFFERRTEHCCPKCKGTQGYEYPLVTHYTMCAIGWDNPPEEGTGGTRCSMGLLECLDCGAKFRESTVLKMLGKDSLHG